MILKEQSNFKTLGELHPKNKDLKIQKDLISKQEILINQLIRLQITGKNPNEIESINSKLATVTIELKNYNNKIQKEFKAEIDKEFSISDLYTKIKKDKAQMVYFFWGNQSVYQFQISEHKMVWNQIPINAAFSENLKNFIRFFDEASNINNDIQLFTKTSYKLFKDLHLSALEKNKNTLIIPDGLLNFVAFRRFRLLKKQLQKIILKFLFWCFKTNWAIKLMPLFTSKINLKKSKIQL